MKKINILKILPIFYLIIIIIMTIIGIYIYNSQYYFSLYENSITKGIGESYNIRIISNKYLDLYSYDYTFESTNNDIATVDNEGIITCIKEGTAKIKIKSNSGILLKVDFKINVVNLLENMPLEKIVFEKSNLNLNIGETLSTDYNIFPSNATNKVLDWSSSNSNIATVDEIGNISAINSGTCNITATSKNGITSSIKVIVNNVSNNIEVSSVNLKVKSKTLNIGNAIKLEASLSPDNSSNRILSWTSSNTKIATVDNNGNVVAISSGVANINVISNNGKIDTCVITVNKPSISTNVEVSSISLNVTNKALNIGEEFNLLANIYPSNATNKTLAFKSSNTDVVKIDEYGKISAVGVGSATITVSTMNMKSASVFIKVNDINNVIDISSINVNESKKTLNIGETFTLTAIILPNNATNKLLTWTSSNPHVATVDNNGNVAALNEGTTAITAESNNGISSTIFISVIKEIISVQAYSISLNVSNKIISVDDNFEIIANIFPANTTNKSLTWTSSNTNIATVDENGKVKAINPGIVIISAKTDNGKQAECTVEVRREITILIGDSRFNHMSMFTGGKRELIIYYNDTNSSMTYKFDNNTYSICMSGANLEWLKSQGNKLLMNMINFYRKENKYIDFNLVFNLGVNDVGTYERKKLNIKENVITNEISYMKNKQKTDWASNNNSNVTIYFLSINPIDEGLYNICKGWSRTNKAINEFNTTYKNYSGFKYCDSSSSIKFDYMKTDNCPLGDGIHYSNETYNNIYYYIKNVCVK